MELKPREEWRFGTKDELTGAMREVLLGFPGLNFGFTQPIDMRVSEMLTGSSGDLAVKVFGNDVATLAQLTRRIQALLRDTEGAVDVQSAVIEGGRFLNIELRQAVAARHGMSVESLSHHVKTQLEGLIVSEIIEGKKRFPLVVASRGSRIDSSSSIEAVTRQLVAMPDGSLAPLQAIADVSFREGPIVIERERGNRFGVLTSNVTGRDIVGFVEEIESRLRQEINLPTGYYVEFGGEFQNQRRATGKLLMVVPAALLLILVILFTTFRSTALAGLILGNIPFALVGGVIALFLAGEYLSVPASVGFIALLGIAVLNGVVMVSHFEQTRAMIGDARELVVQGASKRLRPILMTATTAMFGLLPLVFAVGPGAEIQRPLAIVVIGGLVTSTVTTLYLLPLAYLWMERKRS
jgi:cobalt-zinc-cadmium resistance protein CzcA